MSRGCRSCGRELPPKGALNIDAENVMVMVGDKLVDLTNAEWVVLNKLAGAERLVTHDELMDELRVEDPQQMKVHVCRLRKKVGYERIVTKSKFGYRLNGKVTRHRLA